MTRRQGHKFYAVLLLAVSLSVISLSATGRRAEAGSVGSAADTELERKIASLMKQTGGQHRRALTYNSILARVARERAYDMGTRSYFDHVNPDGLGANYLVTREGYSLPDFYSKRRSGNNIESIAAGSDTPEDAWQNWMGSSGHRTHLLGLTSFYAEQTEYGVGHAYIPDSRYKHYWVVITAKPSGGGGESAEEEDEASSDDEHEAEESGEAEEDEPPDSGGASSQGEESCTCPARSHLERGASGRLKPASGYVWVNPSDPNDLRVKLMPGLIRTEKGTLRPASGYTWVNGDDPKDLRVRRVP
ncbi:MAG TPA: CAP domain-containing protein [Pyrinomonadaceae bacterium]|jgi:hypothetical protein|nr:CAP domain-containing protein [Pyrinomonadaceae bacterium]